MAEQWAVHQNSAMRNIKNPRQLDPSRVGPELARHPTNETALEAARSNRNALHRHLEWDDAVCGVAHRLGQIAALRSCIRLYDEATDQIHRAFISLTDGDDPHRARYYSRQQVLDSVEIQRQVLRKWIARFETIQDDLHEMEDLCSEAREFGRRLRDRLQSFEARPSE